MDVVVPDLGDFSDVEVIDILVRPGDHVDVESPLVTLETDKAAMDVPSPAAGRLREITVARGDRVSAGDRIAVLDADESRAQNGTVAEASAAAAAPAPRGTDAPGAATPRVQTPGAQAPGAQALGAQALGAQAPPRELAPIDEAGFGRAHASPSVRKLARELGVDLGRVRGSGHKNRVTADDVKAFVKGIMLGGAVPAAAALPAVPEVDFAKFGAIETVPLTRIQKISGPRLHASWVNLPHVTQHDLADITELEATRQSLKDGAASQGVRLTPLAFVLRACALTLAEFPAFKSSLNKAGDGLVMKSYTHLGFAADTPSGLVVPVIRDVDRKGVNELARELGELSALARDGKLKAEQIQGSVFTVSSLGGIGGTYFTPIINAPEVAILGVSRSSWQAVYRSSEFVPRLMLPLSLSYDHRVIDGAQAARFITKLSAVLGDVAALLGTPQ